MKYFILGAGSVNDLSKVVEKYLNDGWVLYGTPYVDMVNHRHYQAITKGVI